MKNPQGERVTKKSLRRARANNKKDAPSSQNSWQVLNTRFDKLYTACTTLLDGCKNQGNIVVKVSLLSLQDYLADCIELEKYLVSYETDYQEYEKRLSFPQTDNLKDKLQSLKDRWNFMHQEIAITIQGLCVMLADQLDFRITEKNGKQYVKQSLDYIDTAISYWKKYNKFDMRAKLEDLELVKQKITMKYEPYCLIDAPKNKVEILINKARMAEDREKKYALYLAAAVRMEEETIDDRQQFKLLVEWWNYCQLINKNPSEDVDVRLAHTKRITAPLVALARLKLVNRLIGIDFWEKLCEASNLLYILSHNLFWISKYPELEEDIEKQSELITLADSNMQLSDELAKKINYNDEEKDRAKLVREIKYKLKVIEGERKAQADKAIAIKEMQKDLKEYDEHFGEKLKNFPDVIYETVTPAKETIIWNDENATIVEEASPPIKEKPPEPEPFNLITQLHYLSIAENERDINRQIDIHTYIGENYKKDALFCCSHQRIAEGICHLDKAVEYFCLSNNLIRHADAKTVNELAKKESWLNYLLQETQKLLTTTLDKQRDIQARFILTREQIKAKMGEDWYNNPNTVPSIHAQILKHATQNIGELTRIQRNLNVICKPATESVVAHSMFRREKVGDSEKITPVASMDPGFTGSNIVG